MPDQYSPPTPINSDIKCHLKILSVGDLMYLGREFQASKLLRFWKKFDSHFKIGNLETPINLNIPPSTTRDPLRFNGSPLFFELVNSLKFNSLSIANNHAYDQGRSGCLETIKLLENHRIQVIGTDHQIQITDFKGLKIAQLGLTYGTNLKEDGVINIFNWMIDDSLYWENLIKNIRANVDLIILSIHWGHEFETLPVFNQKQVAQKFIDAGVDLILGHHPHLLQPLEKIQNDRGEALILYSQGNFLNSSIPPKHREGHVFEIDVQIKPRIAFQYQYHQIKTNFLNAEIEVL